MAKATTKAVLGRDGSLACVPHTHPLKIVGVLKNNAKTLAMSETSHVQEHSFDC